MRDEAPCTGASCISTACPNLADFSRPLLLPLHLDAGQLLVAALQVLDRLGDVSRPGQAA